MNACGTIPDWLLWLSWYMWFPFSFCALATILLGEIRRSRRARHDWLTTREYSDFKRDLDAQLARYLRESEPKS